MPRTTFAVITGGAGDIGRATGEALGHLGKAVVVADIDGDAARHAASELKSLGLDAIGTETDVRVFAEIEGAIRIGEQKFSARLDTFVNNAGYTEICDPVDITEEQWDALMAVNARGVLFGLQAAAAAIVDGGTIVNVASATARGPYVSSAHYAASKAAVISLTMTFAAYLAPRGIRVNSVAPAIVDGALWDRVDAVIAQRDGLQPGVAKLSRIEQMPLGRAATPVDVGQAIAFLASAQSSFVTGECLHLTGGSMMR